MRIKDTPISPSGALVAVLLCLGLGAALALLLARPHPQVLPGGNTPAPAAVAILPAPPADFAAGFAPVVQRALPAVVNISSTKVVRLPESAPGFFLRDPFFQQFFGNMFRQSPALPPQRRDRSRGSGVLVRPDGIILTNSHVVEGATEVKVVLADKRQFVATVKGSDPKFDIAVLKIEATKLPTLPIGDSAKLQIGNFVLAIGDPFGIGETVTMGIVSAVGRGHLDIEDYEDFIQTDAAINPGNSGGALIDIYGNLVGINTAILTSLGGGNQGIGFAVPSNLASHALTEILRQGKVVRGYLGVRVQDVTPGLAKAFHESAVSGALISDVDPAGPAQQAGITRGDIILQLDGTPVSDATALRLRTSQLSPKTVVHLRILREGRERDVAVTLGELETKPVKTAPGSVEEERTGIFLGLQVGELIPQVAQELQVPLNTPGVVVVAVQPDSPAAEAGLRRGDIIQQINRQPLRSLRDFERYAKEAGNFALLLVRRGDATMYVTLER